MSYFFLSVSRKKKDNKKELAVAQTALLKPHGSSFLLPEQKKRSKENSPSAFFLPTPVLFSAEQKELATLKQLFVLNAPKSTSASRQKNEVGP